MSSRKVRERWALVSHILVLLPRGNGLFTNEFLSVSELHEMDEEVLLKALNILVKRGKAQIFGQDDSQGVKFF